MKYLWSRLQRPAKTSSRTGSLLNSGMQNRPLFIPFIAIPHNDETLHFSNNHPPLKGLFWQKLLGKKHHVLECSCHVKRCELSVWKPPHFVQLLIIWALCWDCVAPTLITHSQNGDSLIGNSFYCIPAFGMPVFVTWEHINMFWRCRRFYSLVVSPISRSIPSVGFWLLVSKAPTDTVETKLTWIEFARSVTHRCLKESESFHSGWDIPHPPQVNYWTACFFYYRQWEIITTS